MEKNIEVTAYYDKDTKKYHRFLVDSELVKGVVYFARSAGETPKTLMVTLQTTPNKGGN